MPLERVPALPAPWTIVVPFKGGLTAKSRLSQACGETKGLRPEGRHQLALAFLRDTVAAAAAVPAVAHLVVVSSDPGVATAIPDATVLADPGRGLNAAVAAGIEWARSLAPDGPVAALTGDLPCLRPLDLSAALELAREHPLGVVPDRHGTGTTLITAQPGVPVTPRFGPHSCEAHTRADHTALPVPATSTLRQDVDTIADLAWALRRGVGQHTRAAVPQPSSRATRGRRLSVPTAAAV